MLISPAKLLEEFRFNLAWVIKTDRVHLIWCLPGI